jgi:hypothetical protein
MFRPWSSGRALVVKLTEANKTKDDRYLIKGSNHHTKIKERLVIVESGSLFGIFSLIHVHQHHHSYLAIESNRLVTDNLTSIMKVPLSVEPLISAQSDAILSRLYDQYLSFLESSESGSPSASSSKLPETVSGGVSMFRGTLFFSLYH